MNALIVGADKSAIADLLPDTFLLIDDGPVIDAIAIPTRRRVVELNLSTHSFNPLRGINYTRARDLVDVIKAAFPEGENTLTKANAEFQLLEALTSSPKNLCTLIKHTKETQYAYQKIQTILLSPVLSRFLTRPTNFSFDGIILAKLDRSVLSDFDCFLIANLLISNYAGHVVIPDFGFYACPFHTSLIRQDRLIAGVNFLDEAPELKNALLLMKTKLARKATANDAETLAVYGGLAPGTNAHADFIQQSIS